MRHSNQSFARLAVRLALISAIAGLSLSMSGLAFAAHTITSPRLFWDVDDDSIADAADSTPKFQKLGNGWDVAKETRFKEALTTWATTDYNPAFAAAAVNGAYVDGRVPLCEESWGASTVAEACTYYNIRPTTLDIYNAKIYLNSTKYTFYSGANAPPAGQFDMRGIFTHELGHTVYLKDVYGSLDCPPGTTMCGSSTAAQSNALETLAQDDKTAANEMYLP